MEKQEKTSPTPYADLNAVLQELFGSARSVLGKDFIAACLHGSFAVGDFDQHSDVDFIIVIESELSAAQVQALQEMHARIYDLEIEWARHLEGSYFPRDVLRSYSQRGAPLWYLDNGSRSLIQAEHDNTAVVRCQLRDHGVALAGPSPASLVDPVSVDVLRQEIFGVITGWGPQILADPSRWNNRFYQGFIVLSFCRMLHDLNTGRVGSKRAGAEWAKASLNPAWAGLIDRAWDGRPNPAVSVRTPADPVDYQATLEFVRYIISLANQYYSSR